MFNVKKVACGWSAFQYSLACSDCIPDSLNTLVPVIKLALSEWPNYCDICYEDLHVKRADIIANDYHN